MIDNLLRESFMMVIILSALPLLSASLVGLVIGFLQTAMQIQEQTVLYLVKFAVLAIIFVIFGQWYTKELVQLTVKNISLLVSIGKL